MGAWQALRIFKAGYLQQDFDANFDEQIYDGDNVVLQVTGKRYITQVNASALAAKLPSTNTEQPWQPEAVLHVLLLQEYAKQMPASERYRSDYHYSQEALIPPGNVSCVMSEEIKKLDQRISDNRCRQRLMAWHCGQLSKTSRLHVPLPRASIDAR